MKPIILTDVDGVLIRWQSGLPFFAQKYGLKSQAIQSMQHEEKFLSYTEIFGGAFNDQEAKDLFNLYNASEYIKYLASYPDAVKYVNKLKDKFDFISVSALSSDMDTILNRRFNLNAHFPEAFIDFFQCDAGTPKVDVLLKIKHKYKERDIVCFVDDLPHNSEAFNSVFGSEPYNFLLERGENKPCSVDHSKVKSWSDINNELGGL